MIVWEPFALTSPHFCPAVVVTFFVAGASPGTRNHTLQPLWPLLRRLFASLGFSAKKLSTSSSRSISIEQRPFEIAPCAIPIFLLVNRFKYCESLILAAVRCFHRRLVPFDPKG